MDAPFTATTPIGYLGNAEAYRAGAQLLAKELKVRGGWEANPTRYLYYHSIETYLKASLINAGKTETELRRIGHSFQSLAEAANAAGFGLDEPSDHATLAAIDAQGNYLRARYHRHGAFRVATIQSLDLTAHEVAHLTVQALRGNGLAVRTPLPALPIERRFQVS